VIIDFAVESDYGAPVAALHRLIAAGQIENLQPDGAEDDLTVLEYTLLVRPAMA
jgi:hypothetical protein